MLTQEFCLTLDGVRHPYGRTLPGMSVLQVTKFSEEMIESILVQPQAGDQLHRQRLPRHQEAGEEGQATQAWIRDVLAGESRGRTLVGTKSSQMEEVGRVTGMMDPATKVAIITPGRTTLTRMTDPTPGLMALSHSRDGVPMVGM